MGSKTIQMFLFLFISLSLGTFYGCDEKDDDDVGAPSNLSAEIISDSQIRITWNDNSDNEDGFIVERSVDSGQFGTLTSPDANTTSILDSGLSTETLYAYRLKAFNTEKESGYSNTVTVTIPAEIPTTPDELSATATTHNSISLTWRDNSDNETSFVIERQTGDGDFQEIAMLEADSTSYPNTGLNPDTEYSYRIKAANFTGSSTWSSTVSATTDEEVTETAPEAPDNLTASAISHSRINLSWNDNSDNEESFVIERQVAGGSFEAVATVAGGISSYNSTGLQAETRYYYRVMASNSIGNSSYSNVSDATTAVFVETQAVIIDHRCTDISEIPEQAIIDAKQNLHIAYGHTSHGSQLITGMTALNNYMTSLDGVTPGLYAWNDGPEDGSLDLDDYAMGKDLGSYSAWVDNTRNYLGDPDLATGRGTAHSDVNVIIWSWCGQVGDRYRSGLIESQFLTPMSELEDEYPGVTFVYMTGHNDIWNDADTKAGNTIIRNFCTVNNKVLYDFSDIESYDPNGNYFEFSNDDGYYYTGPSGTLSGNFWTEYIDANMGSELELLVNGNDSSGYDGCGRCAHSPEPDDTNTDLKLNCILKGQAAWWLWARIAGWNGTP